MFVNETELERNLFYWKKQVSYLENQSLDSFLYREQRNPYIRYLQVVLSYIFSNEVNCEISVFKIVENERNKFSFEFIIKKHEINSFGNLMEKINKSYLIIELDNTFRYYNAQNTIKGQEYKLIKEINLENLKRQRC